MDFNDIIIKLIAAWIRDNVDASVVPADEGNSEHLVENLLKRLDETQDWIKEYDPEKSQA